MTSNPDLVDASSLASNACWMTLTIPGTNDWNAACETSSGSATRARAAAADGENGRNAQFRAPRLAR